MPLTDVQICRAKAADKALKLTDGSGLYLHVPPTGNKVWRLRYEVEGKEKLLTLAPYPEISLADADLMLARTAKDRVEGAHNRAEHMDRRQEIAQAWADLLMEAQMPIAEPSRPTGWLVALRPG